MAYSNMNLISIELAIIEAISPGITFNLIKSNGTVLIITDL